jgi:hypothetical protein
MFHGSDLITLSIIVGDISEALLDFRSCFIGQYEARRFDASILQYFVQLADFQEYRRGVGFTATGNFILEI